MITPKDKGSFKISEKRPPGWASHKGQREVVFMHHREFFFLNTVKSAAVGPAKIKSSHSAVSLLKPTQACFFKSSLFLMPLHILRHTLFSKNCFFASFLTLDLTLKAWTFQEWVTLMLIPLDCFVLKYSRMNRLLLMRNTMVRMLEDLSRLLHNLRIHRRTNDLSYTLFWNTIHI